MNVRIAKLETTLLRGLNMQKQQPEHDARFCELLAEYETLVDAERATCRRRDHVGAQLDARQETQGRWTEQRLEGVR